eukprot:TRINITY_DN18654_c3_g1_i1.p1 TRINITY_DN18654_c3_g1~~TRINITY_DN18654_c3_g1_i1.p1  ORF type:complete len:467 (+),score=117.52 TRINITY_DN18654_c3_g1_i1:124-1524(+)
MAACFQFVGSLCWGEKAVAGREVAPGEAPTESTLIKKIDEETSSVSTAAADDAPSAAWVESRPKGTPVKDEGFICMGGKAPLCPAPPPKETSGPITLAVLQGSWVGSGGAAISIVGTDVCLNGLPLKNHKVTLRDDGTVVSIGKLWQLQDWAEGGGIEFRASSTRENMESARSEVWQRKEAAGGEDWIEKMRLLGYAGSSAAPLKRGIEGCMPGTTGAEMPSGYATEKDAKDVALLSALIGQYREDSSTTVKILSRQVVPDFTNRAQTGLGVELMHYIATQMKEKGFKKRKGRDGHDIPVVVREPPGTDFNEEALAVWKERVAEEEGFPPVRVDEKQELFTSLGNGHFFQALNLFATEWSAINGSGRYIIGSDKLLAEAINEGVPGVVLKHDTPRAVRAKIAELLNSKREFQWTLGEDGKVDFSDPAENTAYCSQFEWLSKGMDAEQVNCLVRTHLGIKESKRIAG